jgi:hypothetical protein
LWLDKSCCHSLLSIDFDNHKPFHFLVRSNRVQVALDRAGQEGHVAPLREGPARLRLLILGRQGRRRWYVRFPDQLFTVHQLFLSFLAAPPSIHSTLMRPSVCQSAASVDPCAGIALFPGQVVKNWCFFAHLLFRQFGD